MAYADFAYYQDSFYGVMLTEEEFPRLALRASQYLDYITQGRAQRCPGMEPVKMACCALAEQYKAVEAAEASGAKAFGETDEAAGLQSQTVGPLSKTYRDPGEAAASASAAAEAGKSGLYAAAREYLAHTGLLYRGGGRCVSSHCDGL